MTVTPQAQNLRALRTRSHRIATWNVRTLHQPGKTDNVIVEMNRLKISALGLCEVRWTGTGQFQKDEKTISYSGGEQHQHGVALRLGKTFAKSIQAVWPNNERILLVRLKASPVAINIIVAYAPTAVSEEEEIDSFYTDLDEVFAQCKRNEVNLIMGDLNANVGCDRTGNIVGPFGPGEYNDRGERLVEKRPICNEHLV